MQHFYTYDFSNRELKIETFVLRKHRSRNKNSMELKVAKTIIHYSCINGGHMLIRTEVRMSHNFF